MAIWVASEWTRSHMEIILGNVPCLRRMPNGTCHSERHQFLPWFHWKGKLVNLSNQNANGWTALRWCVSPSPGLWVCVFFSFLVGPLRFLFFLLLLQPSFFVPFFYSFLIFSFAPFSRPLPTLMCHSLYLPHFLRLNLPQFITLLNLFTFRPFARMSVLSPR